MLRELKHPGLMVFMMTMVMVMVLVMVMVRVVNGPSREA